MFRRSPDGQSVLLIKYHSSSERHLKLAIRLLAITLLAITFSVMSTIFILHIKCNGELTFENFKYVKLH